MILDHRPARQRPAHLDGFGFSAFPAEDALATKLSFVIRSAAQKPSPSRPLSPPLPFPGQPSAQELLEQGSKRARQLADVDGECSQDAQKKKQRHRLDLVTSRLSSPFASPPTYIRDCGATPTTTLKKATARRSNGEVRTQWLRKAISNWRKVKNAAAVSVEPVVKSESDDFGAVMVVEDAVDLMEGINPSWKRPLPTKDSTSPSTRKARRPSPLGVSNYDAIDLEDGPYSDGGEWGTGGAGGNLGVGCIRLSSSVHGEDSDARYHRYDDDHDDADDDDDVEDGGFDHDDDDLVEFDEKDVKRSKSDSSLSSALSSSLPFHPSPYLNSVPSFSPWPTSSSVDSRTRVAAVAETTNRRRERSASSLPSPSPSPSSSTTSPLSVGDGSSRKTKLATRISMQRI